MCTIDVSAADGSGMNTFRITNEQYAAAVEAFATDGRSVAAAIRDDLDADGVTVEMQSVPNYVNFLDAMECSKESAGKYTCMGWQPKYQSNSDNYTAKYPRFG